MKKEDTDNEKLDWRQMVRRRKVKAKKPITHLRAEAWSLLRRGQDEEQTRPGAIVNKPVPRKPSPMFLVKFYVTLALPTTVKALRKTRYVDVLAIGPRTTSNGQV